MAACRTWTNTVSPLNRVSASRHIIVTMHVPPRKDPLPAMLDAFIEEEYAACLRKNPVITMAGLKA